MTALVGLLLNKGAAQCDRQAIYIDCKVIAQRPPHLPDSEWNALCRYVCNEPPVVDRLTFTDPSPDDPAAWARIETYMEFHERGSGSSLGKGKRK